MAGPEPKLRELFSQAAAFQTAEEQAAFVDQACGGDAPLRAQLEELLRAQREAGSFLQEPSALPAVTVDDVSAAERPGTVIGPYKLLEPIGEGGMGTVFLALQSQPVRRKVALKLIKSGMDTRQVVARFEVERQALALMDHPNIAKVLDAGQMGSGRPYFVMELVNGLPITEFCDQGRLGPRERLELFVHVCQAVQHAHHKGIIHRDIKPSNVLVTIQDGTPLVKVIDFGIAKAVGQQLTDKTLFTGFAQMIGTPLYMSPEQVALSNVDVDTRSDIYSLGVLLYELLTSTTPFDKDRFKGASYDEIRRIIREEEPPKPSTRISTLGGQASTVWTHRKIDPRRLSRLVRGELDWIVMKALEKDRNRRYESAGAFAADVQRYLADETVLACPPSVGYRLRKFLRRHKTALGVATAVLLVMLAAAGGAAWRLWERAAQFTATEHEVTVALTRTEHLAAQARKMPSTNSGQAAAALVVWQQAADNLGQAAAALGAGTGDHSLRQRVAAVQAEVERDLGKARRKAKLFHDLDDARMASAMLVEGTFAHATARAKYEAALAAFDLDMTALATDELARRISAQEPEVRDALVMALDDWAVQAYGSKTSWSPAKLRALAKAADNDNLRQRYRAATEAGDVKTLRDLSAEARQFSFAAPILHPLAINLLAHGLRDEAFALLRWGRDRHPTDFWLHFSLGSWLHHKRATPLELEEALGCYRACLALRPNASVVHYNLGIVLDTSKRPDEALAAFQKAVDIDPTDALHHYSLGAVWAKKKQWDKALDAYRTASRLDPELAQPHNGIGNLHTEKKQWDKALAEYDTAIKLNPRYAPPHVGRGKVLSVKRRQNEAMAAYDTAIQLDHDNAAAHNNRGSIFQMWQRWDEAAAAFEKAVKLDPDFAPPHIGLASVHIAGNRWDEALAEINKAIVLDPNLAHAHYNLGIVLHHKKQLGLAVAAFEKAIELDPDYAPPYNGLGLVLRDLKQLDKAMAKYDQAIKLDPTDPRPHHGLGLAWLDKREFGKAKAAYEKAIALDDTYDSAHVSLGRLLCEQQLFDEAIPVFEKLIQRDPANAGLYFNLGKALRYQGRFAQAVQAMQKSDELGRKQPGWSFPSGELIKRFQHLVFLKDKEQHEPVSLAAAEKGVSAQLAKDDPLDCFSKTARSYRKSYAIELKAGLPYQIDLTGDFDVYLRVEDRHYVTLAFNDDVTPPADLNSRVVFTPQKDAVYRLVVTSVKPGDTGKYTLAVNEVAKAGSGQTLKDELKKTDANAKGTIFKAHKIDLVAGRPYVFELDSPSFTPSLLLGDAKRKQLLARNDGAGDLDTACRIDFTPKETGIYDLIVTSRNTAAAGIYTLRIQGYEAKK
jgi:serine/threonine protein kinase/tetratricopeptide (TPR) repeat protein